jgi:hypothetical protein
MTFHKTAVTPEWVELLDLSVIWKALQEDSDPNPRNAFRKLLRGLSVRMVPNADR